MSLLSADVFMSYGGGEHVTFFKVTLKIVMEDFVRNTHFPRVLWSTKDSLLPDDEVIGGQVAVLPTRMS